MEPLADRYAHPAEVAQDALEQQKLQKTAPLPKRLHRARPAYIVLTVLLVLIAVIAAVGNQAVSKHLQNYLTDHPRAADYTRGAVQAALTFHWRFSAQHGQPTHVWAAQFAVIAALLVLSGLLTWAVSRGSVTFSRIWVSIAAIVSAVTPIAVMVGNVILVPNAPGPGQSRVGQAIYADPSFGPVIVAGLVLGVVTGLFAALLAIITRRSVSLADVATAAAVDAPLNAYGVPTPGYEPPPWQAGGEAAGQPFDQPVPEAAVTTYIPPYAPGEELAANRGPLDHLQPPLATAPVPLPPSAPIEPPTVTTAESAAIAAPTQTMHIEMTQPDIVLAEDGTPDPAHGSEPDPERTLPPTPADALEDTQPPAPTEVLPIEDDHLDFDAGSDLPARSEPNPKHSE